MSDWRHRAMCRDEEPELFFPIGIGLPAQRQTREAKRVCSRCPVVSDCLEWALKTGQHGIWGGTDEDERRVLKRQRALFVARHGREAAEELTEVL